MASQSSSVCGEYLVVFTEVTHCGDGDSLECNISVNENKSGKCYVLDYKWSGKHPVDNAAYPLEIRDKYGDETYDITGVIVAKNDMTTQMIRHLVMPDADLQSVCGMGTSTDYRSKIIRALATMWD